jgi:hypothetical protein
MSIFGQTERILGSIEYTYLLTRLISCLHYSNDDDDHLSFGLVDILQDWNPDPGRPPAPNYFRLLFMGRQLADPEVLAGKFARLAVRPVVIDIL